MELREPIEDINRKLLEEFGREMSKELPRFRVVFSEDQFEKRITEFSDEGFELQQPEVRTLPKYRQYIKEKYVLERYIPVTGETDLVDKMSYEPLWVFQTKDGQYLPPFYEGCKLVIESMYERINKTGFAKYKDKNISKEERLAHLMKVELELFGNETPITDSLHYGSGVTVPGKATVN
jgi:hypothetical protein